MKYRYVIIDIIMMFLWAGLAAAEIHAGGKAVAIGCASFFIAGMRMQSAIGNYRAARQASDIEVILRRIPIHGSYDPDVVRIEKRWKKDVAMTLIIRRAIEEYHRTIGVTVATEQHPSP